MSDPIQKAIDNYIAMEQDARVMDLIRKGELLGIQRLGDGRWRVDSAKGFALAKYPHDAIQQLLNL